MTKAPQRSAPVTLTDGVVVLRPFRVDDADVLVEHQDDAMIRWLQWERALDRQTARSLAARWESAWRADGIERNFAVEDAHTGEVVGDCEVEDLGDGTVNVMYMVFPSFRRRGYSVRAATLVIGYARTVFPHADPILRIHAGNTASEAVASALGAVFDGTTEPSRLGPPLKRYRLPPAP